MDIFKGLSFILMQSLKIQDHTIVWKLGIIGGLVHHFTCQYSRQVDALTALLVFGFASSCFGLVVLLTAMTPTLVELLLGFLVFDTLYVKHPKCVH